MWPAECPGRRLRRGQKDAAAVEADEPQGAATRILIGREEKRGRRAVAPTSSCCQRGRAEGGAGNPLWWPDCLSEEVGLGLPARLSRGHGIEFRRPATGSGRQRRWRHRMSSNFRRRGEGEREHGGGQEVWGRWWTQRPGDLETTARRTLSAPAGRREGSRARSRLAYILRG